MAKKKGGSRHDRFDSLSAEDRLRVLGRAAKFRKAAQMGADERTAWRSRTSRADFDDAPERELVRPRGDAREGLEDYAGKALALADDFKDLGGEGGVELHRGVVISLSKANGWLQSTVHGRLPFVMRPELAMIQKSVVAVGEEVMYSLKDEGQALLERPLPRRSVLSRPDPTARGLERVIAVNVDLVAIVMSLCEPAFNAAMVDRFLVAVCQSGAKPMVILNKMDLAQDGAAEEAILATLADWRAAGAQVLAVSAQEGTHIAELRALIAGRAVVFTGPSGVGKSSLLNALDPDLDEFTQEVARSGKGRHTTVMAVMHLLPDGTRLLDTPGIREVGLCDIDAAELPFAFPEFQTAGPCRFNDCVHDREGGCAVQAAVQAGQLSRRRYESYLRLLHDRREHARLHPEQGRRR